MAGNWKIYFAVSLLRVIHYFGGLGVEGVVNHGFWSASFDNGSPSPELLLHLPVIYNDKDLLCVGDLWITLDVQFIFAE